MPGQSSILQQHLASHSDVTHHQVFVKTDGPMDVQVSPGSLSGPSRIHAASASPAAAPSKVSCADCGASFSRREHLQRHRRSHTNERPYSCAQCGNSFSRMDVLAKHAESHKQMAVTPSRIAKAFSRACVECANIRIRCSRGDPCQRCGDRGLRCTYPTARKRKASAVEAAPDCEARAEEPGKERASNDYEEATGNKVHTVTTMAESGAAAAADASMENRGELVTPTWEMQPHMVVSESSLPADAVQSQASNGSAMPTAGDSQVVQGMDWFALNWLSPSDLTRQDGLDPENVNVTNPPQAEGIYQLFDYPFPASLPPAEQWAWASPAANFDRAVHVLEPSTQPGHPSGGQVPQTGSMLMNAVEGSEESSASATTPATLYVDGGAARAPFKGLAAQRGVNVHDEDSDAGSGIDHHPVREHTGKGALSPQASENILSGLRNSVSLEQLRGGCFPTSLQLQTFFRLYFRYFHPSFPFLRPDPTFYDEALRWPLTLAVCTIGAQYCSKPDNALTRHFLVEVLQQVSSVDICHALSETSGGWESFDPADEGNLLRICLIQAIVLNVICQFHASERPSSQKTAISHFTVVQACRNMSLLERRFPVETTLAASQGPQWSVDTWVWQQSLLRTGYMIWLLDSLLAIESESETLLSLGDIQCSLPAREYAWESPTLGAVAKEDANKVEFLDAMEMLYIEKKLPKGLSEFGTIIMTHVIIQRTRAVIKQYQTGLASWVPSASSQKRAPSRRVEETWPPCLPILSKWRNSACDCLDVLHWNANSISARDGGWEPFTIFHLHLSRLVLLTPVGPLRALTRAAVSEHRSPAHHAREMQTARHQILRWAISDQYKARLAVIHAGALFWHVRRYSINSFVEPLGIFLATLVLWGYSVASASYVESPVRGTAHDDVQDAQANQRGERSELSPASSGSPVGPSPLSGLDEDPEGMQFYVDRPCDDEIVQAYVVYGRKMSGRLSHVGDLCHVDAPRKILMQGQRLLEAKQRSGKQRTGDGCGTSPSNPGGPVAWGVAVHYLEVLRDFSRTEYSSRP